MKLIVIILICLGLAGCYKTEKQNEYTSYPFGTCGLRIKLIKGYDWEVVSTKKNEVFYYNQDTEDIYKIERIKK